MLSMTPEAALLVPEQSSKLMKMLNKT